MKGNETPALIDSVAEPQSELVSMTEMVSPIWKQIIFWILCFGTVGMVPLLCFWSIRIRRFFLYQNTSFNSGNYLFSVADDGAEFISEITTNQSTGQRRSNIRLKQYVQSKFATKFSPLPDMPLDFTEQYLRNINLPERSAAARKLVKDQYGPNTMEIPVQTWFTLFLPPHPQMYPPTENVWGQQATVTVST